MKAGIQNGFRVVIIFCLLFSALSIPGRFRTDRLRNSVTSVKSNILKPLLVRNTRLFPAAYWELPRGTPNATGTLTFSNMFMVVAKPASSSVPLEITAFSARLMVVEYAVTVRSESPSRTAQANSSTNLPIEPLTHRERDVLLYVASGKSNKQIAKKLRISAKTVEVYLYRITRKLRVPTRVGVAVMAVKLGLVDVRYEDLQVGELEEL